MQRLTPLLALLTLTDGSVVRDHDEALLATVGLYRTHLWKRTNKCKHTRTAGSAVRHHVGHDALRLHRLEELHCMLGLADLRVSGDERRVGDHVRIEPLRLHRFEEPYRLKRPHTLLRASADQWIAGDHIRRKPLRQHRLEEVQCLLNPIALRASTA